MVAGLPGLPSLGGSSSSSGFSGGGFPSTAAFSHKIPKPKKPKEHGMFHFLHPLSPVEKTIANLGKDIRDTTTGLPMGLAHLATHPVDSIAKIGHAEWHDWSPLFKGHAGEWARNFEQHPLGPLLDVSAIVTGGGALTGRLARAATEAGAISETSGGIAGKLARASKPANIELTSTKAGKGVEKVFKPMSGNPVIRARQHIFDVNMKKLRTDFPIFGEESRFQRLETKQTNQLSEPLTLATRVLAKGYQKLYNKDPVKAGAAQAMGFAHIGKMMLRAARPMELVMNRYGIKVAPKGMVGLHKDLNNPDVHWEATYKNKTGEEVTKEIQPTRDPGAATLHPRTYAELLPKYTHAITTHDPEMMMKDANGNVLLIPQKAIDAYTAEGVNTANYMRRFGSGSNSVYKGLILNLAPRFFVNNALGNWTMAALAYGSPSGIKAFAQTVKDQRAVNKEMRTHVDSVGKVIARTAGHDIISDYAAEQAYNNIRTVIPQWGRAGDEGRIQRGINRAALGLYPFTSKYAHQFPRGVGMNFELRKAPEVKALMKQGKTFEEARQEALAGNPLLKHRVDEAVNNVMGDYFHKSPLEKTISDYVPFYLWDKHLGRFVTSLPAYKKLGVADVGRTGHEDMVKTFGNVPNYLEGMVPIPKFLAPGKVDKGRRVAVNTEGWNPFATFPRITEATAAVVHGSPSDVYRSIGGDLGPLPKTFGAAISGKKPTGAEDNTTGGAGLFGSFIKAYAETPTIALAFTAGKGAGKSYKTNYRTGEKTPKLYQAERYSKALSFLGFPERKISTSASHNLFDVQEGIRRKKKKKISHSTGFGGF